MQRLYGPAVRVELTLSSLDEQVSHQLLRSRHEGVAVEVGDAVLREHCLVDEEPAGYLSSVARQNAPCGIRHDFGPAAVRGIDPGNHLQRSGRNDGPRPEAVDADPMRLQFRSMPEGAETHAVLGEGVRDMWG